MRITYHKNGTKSISTRNPSKSYEIEDNKPFHERITRNYYDLECAQKLAPGTNKNWIKRVWERDAARKEAGIGD